MGPFSKIFDSILADKLYSIFESRIIVEQHGFMRGRSAVTNLLLYTDYLVRNLDNGIQIDSVYFDFAKAFDSVNHEILLKKLQSLGIGGSLLSWLKSYLSNRTQIVKIDGNLSSPIKVSSGVPQGSHLGPLLFILFINDIMENITFAKLLLYADDVKLFHTICSISDAIKLQRDIDALAEWARQNKLKLNIKKCKSMSFQNSSNSIVFDYFVNESLLERVNEISDLGVIFESSLRFDKHIEYVVSKSYKTVGFILRSCREFRNVKTITYLYKTLVVPVLCYASQIWRPSQLYLRYYIEKVQHKLVRFLSYKMCCPMAYTDHDYTVINEKVGLATLESIYNCSDILLVHNILRNNINCAPVCDLFTYRDSHYTLRNQRILRESNVKKMCFFTSVVHRLRRSWNLLPRDLVNNTDTNSFKRSLRLSFYNY